MRSDDAALVAALERCAIIVEATLQQLTAITLARVARTTEAYALTSGASVAIEPTHIVVVAEQALWDTLIEQLKEIRAVSIELTRILTPDPPVKEEAGTWDMRPDTAPHSAPTAETSAPAVPPLLPPNGRRKKTKPTT